MLRADGCIFQQIGLALHDEFSGSRLDAATAFLRAHPGQVSPITLSDGGADMGFAIDCNAVPVCVASSGVFRRYATTTPTTVHETVHSTPPAPSSASPTAIARSPKQHGAVTRAALPTVTRIV